MLSGRRPSGMSQEEATATRTQFDFLSQLETVLSTLNDQPERAEEAVCVWACFLPRAATPTPTVAL